MINSPSLSPIFIQIHWLIIAEPKPENNYYYSCHLVRLLLPQLFIFIWPRNSNLFFIWKVIYVILQFFLLDPYRFFLFIHSPILRTIHGRRHLAECVWGPAGECFRDSLFPLPGEGRKKVTKNDGH